VRMFPSCFFKVWRRTLTCSFQSSTPPLTGMMSLSVTGILKCIYYGINRVIVPDNVFVNKEADESV
jgi:hypothetical protein